MQKIVEHILFDQDKREFIIEHNLGIDRISKDSIKKISYRKLPVWIGELIYKNLFVKENVGIDFTAIVKKPFTVLLTNIIIILFGITLFKQFLNLMDVSHLVFFINGSDINQTKGLFLITAFFVVIPFLVFFLFYIISILIDFLLFGKITRNENFDFELKVYDNNIKTYFYDHKEVSIYQVFIKQGIESIDKSKSTSINFWFSLFCKLLIFTFLVYVSFNFEFNFKNIFSFLNFDVDLLNYEIFQNSSSINQSQILNDKTGSLSPLNSKVYYANIIILNLVGICFFVLLFAYFLNFLFLMISLFLGPFVFILISVVDYVFEYLRAKKSKYSDLTPLIPYSLTKLNVFFILIMLVNWKLSNEISYLPITLTICLIVIAIVNYIILLRFKSVIHYTNHIPISLYSNMYVAELICKNQRFDLLNKMNPVLFINNKYWVESKLIEGYKIMPYCDEKLSIQIDKHYYLDYVKNEKSDELQPLPNYFSNDKEFITELLNVNGLYLKYASRWLKSNVETVSLAVRLNGLALEFVDECLKDNKEIVLLAVKSNGIALKFASQGLSLDKEVVLTALKSNKEAFAFIGNKLKNDEDILKYLH